MRYRNHRNWHNHEPCHENRGLPNVYPWLWTSSPNPSGKPASILSWISILTENFSCHPSPRKMKFCNSVWVTTVKEGMIPECVTHCQEPTAPLERSPCESLDPLLGTSPSKRETSMMSLFVLAIYQAIKEILVQWQSKINLHTRSVACSGLKVLLWITQLWTGYHTKRTLPYYWKGVARWRLLPKLKEGKGP